MKKSSQYVKELKQWEADLLHAHANMAGESLGKFKQDHKNKFAELAAAALQDLTSQRDKIAERQAQAQTAEQQARAAWANSWDYARLNYTQETIKAAVNRANNPADILQAYNEATQNGDTYAIRAWGEVGAGLITKKDFDPTEKSRLVSAMKKDLEALQNTPEVQAARELAQTINAEAENFRRDVIEVRNTMNSYGEISISVALESL